MYQESKVWGTMKSAPFIAAGKGIRPIKEFMAGNVPCQVAKCRLIPVGCLTLVRVSLRDGTDFDIGFLKEPCRREPDAYLVIRDYPKVGDYCVSYRVITGALTAEDCEEGCRREAIRKLEERYRKAEEQKEEPEKKPRKPRKPRKRGKRKEAAEHGSI